MDRGSNVEMLRAMLGDDGTTDDVLSVYLDIAGMKILNKMYPFRQDYAGLEVPDRYATTQLTIACYLLNKRGAEGQIQHIENGINRNYGSADVPDAMLQHVTPFAQAIR